MPMIEFREPLEESAPLAWRMAPRLCRREAASGEDCSWYHGFWQLLRLMKLVTTPEVDAEFLDRSFAALGSRPGAARLLICGAADYCVLAHAIECFRRRKADLRAAVVDSCETPLFLNRWYAERVSHAVETHHADIFEHSPPQAYDAVSAHSFLGHVHPERRDALVAAWRKLLRPGGIAILVNRVRPGFAGGLAAFSEPQLRSFCASVAGAADSLRRLELDPGELARAAETFARRRRPYPTRSAGEIAGLLERGGFAIEEMSEASVPISRRGGESGPTGDSERVRILARRL